MEQEATIRGPIRDGYIQVKKIRIAPEGTYVEDEYNSVCLEPRAIEITVEEEPHGPRFTLTLDELLKVYKEHTGRKMV